MHVVVTGGTGHSGPRIISGRVTTAFDPRRRLPAMPQRKTKDA